MAPLFKKLVTIFVVAMVLVTCTHLNVSHLSYISNKDYKTLMEGLKAFKERKYKKAVAIFETVEQSATDKTIKRKALYGLSVTRLILSNTRNDFNEAIAIWQSWGRLYSKSVFLEDPRLLEPLIFCKYIAEPRQTEAGFIVEPCDDKDAKMLCHEKEELIRILNEKLVAKARELKKLEELKKKLAQKNEQISALKSKIKALEAIDQKIEKKKTEISSPK